MTNPETAPDPADQNPILAFQMSMSSINVRTGKSVSGDIIVVVRNDPTDPEQDAEEQAMLMLDALGVPPVRLSAIMRQRAINAMAELFGLPRPPMAFDPLPQEYQDLAAAYFANHVHGPECFVDEVSLLDDNENNQFKNN